LAGLFFQAMYSGSNFVIHHVVARRLQRHGSHSPSTRAPWLAALDTLPHRVPEMFTARPEPIVDIMPGSARASLFSPVICARALSIFHDFRLLPFRDIISGADACDNNPNEVNTISR
jgi:hypothetical protein